MNFLPEGTSIPQASDKYFKFELGDNRFRILGSAIVGFELWVEGKPVRRKTADQFTPEELRGADINKFNGLRKTPQYFWAFPVWNYETEKVQILEVTQSRVMRAIESYLNDEDYGKDPTQYDLVVVKDEAANKKIEYSVKAKPPKPLDEGIAQLFKDMKIRLEALYEGGDPFNSDEPIDNDKADEAIQAQMQQNAARPSHRE